MKPLTIQQVRQAVGGKNLAPIPEDAPRIKAVCTDTRRMEPGSLFVALRGEHFDAHEFIPDAAAGGAVAALVDTAPVNPLPNVQYILVPDTRAAMGRLARYVREQMRAKVIGVAGSNGKTSTKYLIHAALSSTKRGTFSPKSFNNDIGVPLTIFPADPAQDYLVLELGTNHPGEIRNLTNIALPDIAVITNCGAEHLEFLGDIRGVRQENATVIEGLDPEGWLIVNGDDPELLDAVSAFKGKRITFGFKETNNLFATDIQCDATGVRFRLNKHGREVFVPMLGRHTACNALAAIAIGRAMRIPEDQIIEALAEAEGPDMRLQLTDFGGISLLNDAYNANPNSMRAALETVSVLPVPAHGRRIAVLGDMRELGKASERYHREIGEFARTCPLDALVCVGEQAELIAEAALKSGMSADAVFRYTDARSAARMLPQWLHDGDLVLLKASRGIHLEAVAEAVSDLAQAAAEAAAPPAAMRKVAG